MEEIAKNKRAYFDYDILEKIEAGMELKGFEVKAIKSGRINLSGSYVVINDNQAWLLNTDVPAYQPGNTPDKYDSKRTRRLLIKKSEIKNLIGKTAEKTLTIVPLRVYLKKSLIKLEIGLAKSRKKFDKREVIKKREVEREIRQFRGR